MKDREKEHFGWAVDAIGGAMKGLLIYCILLLAGFKLYQSGKGAFRPFLYALAVPLSAVIAWCYNRKGTAARRHMRRFKSLNYFLWGAGMFACSLFLNAMAEPATDALPISVQTCRRYMTAAFGIYLVLVILLEYVFQQYDYYRNYTGIDKNTFFHLKRMNVIVTVIAAILIFFVVIVSKETFAVWLMKGYLKILGFLVGAGIIGLGKLKSAQNLEGAHVDPGGLSGLTRKIKAAPDSRFPVSIVVTILLVLAVLYLLWRLYTKLGANYRAGGDEAQYIPRHPQKEFEIMSIREEREHIRFGFGNRAKVRKMYYKTMNRRMKKDNMEQVKGKTPAELAKAYAQAGEQKRFEKMSAYYEKARYAKEECTDEDVEAVRKLTSHAETEKE